MSSDIRRRAEERFAGLRFKALNGWRFEEHDPTPAAGWCVSTLARVCVNAPSLVSRLEALQAELDEIGELYVYPSASLHVSLLGCTPREASSPLDQSERLARIDAAVAATLADVPSPTFEIGRLNLIGIQLFLEVYSDSSAWSDLRHRLAEAMTAIGESPLAYADTEPMHLNVARIAAAPGTAALHDALLAKHAIGEVLAVTAVELVVTDFLVTPSELRVLATYPLPA